MMMFLLVFRKPRGSWLERLAVALWEILIFKSGVWKEFSPGSNWHAMGEKQGDFSLTLACEAWFFS